MEDTTTSFRRTAKSSKRALAVDSEDEEEDADISPPKRRRVEDDNLLDFADDADLDDAASVASIPKHTPTTSRQRKSTKKMSSSKPRKAVASDPDSEEEETYIEEDDDIVADVDILENDDGDDDDFVEELERKRPAKGKGMAKGKGGKGGKSSKAKGEEPKEILIKDERQGTSSSKRIIVEDNVSTPAKDNEDTSLTKKKKLPNIKKNKPSGITTGSTAPTNPKSISTSKTPADGISLTPSTPATRVPPASTDFDLRDKNVYAMLLGGSGGSSTASGTKRVKEEQRRKELNKLRDEAKAKRAMEAKDSFDLQAGVDKILRFEERLRRANSAVLYPNILGGKMKEVWEYDRRRRDMEAAKREFEASHEEGEMLA